MTGSIGEWSATRRLTPLQAEVTLLIPRLVVGAPGSWRVIRYRMKLQEGGCGVAGASLDFAGVRPLCDAEQQVDLQIAPEQPRELICKFGRASCEKSGRLGSGHDFAQGDAALLASYRVEGTRHFGGVHHLRDRQPKYGNDRGIACLADELRAERN